MEIGAVELQIFVSLVVVLGVAFVALICDFLKGNNERLREHNIELRVRREEQQKSGAIDVPKWLQNLLVNQRTSAPPPRASMPPAAASPPAGTRLSELPQRPALRPHRVVEARPEAAARVAAHRMSATERTRTAASVRVTGEANGSPRTPAMLENLPVPAWVKKEAEEREAARRAAASQSRPAPQVPKNEPAAEAKPPAEVKPPANTETRLPTPGLLERVVAVTTVGRSGKGQPESGFEAEPSLESLAKASTPASVSPEPEIEYIRVPETVAPVVRMAAAVRPKAPAPPAPVEVEPLPPVPVLAEPVVSMPVVVETPSVAGEPAAEAEPAPVIEDTVSARVAAAACEIPDEPILPPVVEPLREPFIVVPPGADAPVLTEALVATEQELLPEVEFTLEQPVSISIESKPVEAAEKVEENITPSWEIVQPQPEQVARPVEPPHELDECCAPPPIEVAALPKSDPWEVLKRLGLLRESPAEEAAQPPQKPAEFVSTESQNWDMPEFEPAVWRPSVSDSSPAEAAPAVVEPPAIASKAEPAQEVQSEVDAAAMDTVDEQADQQSETVGPVLVASNELPEIQLPPGLHSRAVLNGLTGESDPLSGVVVAIGINDYQRMSDHLGRSGTDDLMRSVDNLVRSLLREQDFACRNSDDEYILVYPHEAGASAQRRLNYISERLWDFQLRSLGAYSILFSWGAVEVQRESLADAVASACDRMYQTKRSRKTVSMDAGRSRKRAV